MIARMPPPTAPDKAGDPPTMALSPLPQPTRRTVTVGDDDHVLALYDHLVQIQTGTRVKLRVRLEVVGGATIEDGQVEYIHGGGKMLPGLESALTGLEQGATTGGILRARDAFGNPALSPHKKMKRGEFP